jgi:hypothetical protein
MRKGFRVEDLSLSLMVWSGMHWSTSMALHYQDKAPSSKMKMLFVSAKEPVMYIFGANEITFTITKLNNRYIWFICRQKFRHIT